MVSPAPVDAIVCRRGSANAADGGTHAAAQNRAMPVASFFIALRNNLEKPAAGFVKKASLECGAKHSCVTYLCRFIAHVCRRWQRSVRANGRGDRVTPVLWRVCGTIDPDLKVAPRNAGEACRRSVTAHGVAVLPFELFGFHKECP
ncbi:hypothetical protein SLW56_00145 [Xanthomonas sp. LF07-6]|uniref:hypothetical protein n=1 Tax=Xanthomonas sp. LF07-6 TaxID=3097550 RepID=UPI002A82EF87|nr:hypothetical protein [Xanthomonas sp. LF07-6]MDY4338187.1 hypothetical protein [Xanthomonas sp. LF07-6]